MKNLQYNEEQKRWYTHYPWKFERSALPRNEATAMKRLLSIEKSLQSKPEEAKEWNEQIGDMLKRGVAVVLTEDELNNWKGDYHYLAPVAVKGKKSMRLCFDAARRQGGYPSMNDCLH